MEKNPAAKAAAEQTQNGSPKATEVQQLPKGQTVHPQPLPSNKEVGDILANSLERNAKKGKAKSDEVPGNKKIPKQPGQKDQSQPNNEEDDFNQKRFYLQNNESDGNEGADGNEDGNEVDGNEGADGNEKKPKKNQAYEMPDDIKQKLTAAEQAQATLIQILSNPSVKAVLEAEKSGKKLFDMVSEYQALDPKNKSDEQLLKDYIVNDLELKETDPDYAKMMDELNGSISRKREVIVSQKKQQEAEYQAKLKELPEIQAPAQSQENKQLQQLGKEVNTLMLQTKGKYFGNIMMDEVMLGEVQSFIKSGAPFVPVREDGSLDAKEYLNMALYANPKTRKVILTEAYNDGVSDAIGGKVFKQIQGTINRNPMGSQPAKRTTNSPEKAHGNLISSLAKTLGIILPTQQD